MIFILILRFVAVNAFTLRFLHKSHNNGTVAKITVFKFYVMLLLTFLLCVFCIGVATTARLPQPAKLSSFSMLTVKSDTIGCHLYLHPFMQTGEKDSSVCAVCVFC